MEPSVQAKSIATPSEDIVADGPDWYAVVDGATDKSGIDFDGATGGLVVARIVADVVVDTPGGCSAAGLVERIHARYRDELTHRLAGIDPVLALERV